MSKRWNMAVVCGLVAFVGTGMMVSAWPSDWPKVESDVHVLFIGTVIQITGVFLDGLDAANMIAWQGGKPGTAIASFPVSISRPEYKEWHYIYVEGICSYSNVAPWDFQVGGFLAEYDPATHRTALIDQTSENLLYGGKSDPGTIRFRLRFRFCIDAGSVFGPMAGYRQILGKQNFYETLREGSASDPAELIIFLGGTMVPQAAGGWTWWSVWGN